MTRIELIQRQRRFEWELARDHQAVAAERLVKSRTHDLLNLIQIVDLASQELERRGAGIADVGELTADLRDAAEAAKQSLQAVLAIARPAPIVTRGAPVAAAVTAAIAASGLAIALQLELAGDVATGCTAAELDYLVLALLLDAGGPIDLLVRARAIVGVRWLELVRGTPDEPAPLADRDELRGVPVLLARHAGELAMSERRGGGSELVVALPIVA